MGLTKPALIMLLATFAAGCAMHNRLGVMYASKGNFDQAIEEFSSALAQDSTNALVYNNRGVAYVAQGRHDLAMADYDRAIELDPQLALAYWNKARLLERMGRQAEARTYYREAAVKADSTKEPALAARARERAQELEAKVML